MAVVFIVILFLVIRYLFQTVRLVKILYLDILLMRDLVVEFILQVVV
ncbi:hypothetical protein SDC9_144089 [bioreactor metagenome]|uniref:Uncharacterized protein n=1 Tax=bioreactor metagenome TaxID=1076179 RepID=A0A645E554_9ZZZZ